MAAFAAAMLIGSPDPAARSTPRVVKAGETAVLVFTRTTGFRHDSIPVRSVKGDKADHGSSGKNRIVRVARLTALG